MNLKKIIISIVIVGIFLWNTAALCMPLYKSKNIELIHNNSGDVISNYLTNILGASGKVGRIYYTGICASDLKMPLRFPDVVIRRPSGRSRGLRAVQEMFHDDKAVRVTESPKGIIRIWIGHPPDEILKTYISTVSLTPSEQYNENPLFRAIEKTPEFKSNIRRLNLYRVPVFIDELGVLPDIKFVHVPAVIKDITTDRLLDIVATTFDGIVLYGVCKKKFTEYEFDFWRGPYAD